MVPASSPTCSAHVTSSLKINSLSIPLGSRMFQQESHSLVTGQLAPKSSFCFLVTK